MSSLLTAALISVYDRLTDFANLSVFWDRLNDSFGTEYDRVTARNLRSQWQNRDFGQIPSIETVSSSVLNNVQSVYRSDTNTIYLSDDFIATATPETLATVLLKEIGHFIDAKVNKTAAPLDGQNSIVTQSSLPVVYENVKIGTGFGLEVSGTNAVWTTSKGNNSFLYFYNGTTTTAIANRAYYSLGTKDYAISGNNVVYVKKDGADTEIYRYSAGTTTKLTNNTINDYAPQIDGSNIVWYANDGTDVEIFRNNGTTTTQLTNNTADEYDLALSGSNTVWAGWDGNDYEIYLNNGTTTTQLTNNSSDDYSPVISSNRVAWFNWTGSQENLLYYDGVTNTQITTNLDVYSPIVAGDKVVYAKYDGTNYSLQLYNATTKTTTQLSSNFYFSDYNSQISYKTDGNWVVWLENSTNYSFKVLKLYNGTSTITLSDRFYSSSPTSALAIANNKVAWVADASNSSYPSGNNSQIFLYEGATNQLTGDTDGKSPTNLSIASNSVFWQGGNALYETKPSTKPSLSINNITVVEGQTSPQNAVLTVTLSAASTTSVTVQYATVSDYSSGLAASPGYDYTTTTGTLTFSAGQLTQTISVPILDDNYSESDETFTVKLSSPTVAVLVPNQNVGTVTITDTLQASVTTTLPTGVENLTLTGTGNINGTGNSHNNTIRGNSGNNILDNNGGYDTLIGGGGNDTYVVSSSSGANITENADEGTDTVQYSGTNSFYLGDNLENLTLLGTNNISGSGNSLNNVITGNGGNNYLSGYTGNDTLNGGDGNDSLYGGTGDDLYMVDSTTDYISENSGEGTDTVQASVTFSLPNSSSSSIENLTLTGSTAINGTGNSLNNVIVGNSANNTLTGGGGKDTLTGGGGIDRLDYKTLGDSLLANYDAITDFNANTGNDLFLVTTARAGFTANAGVVATLDSAGITARLNTTNFAANFAARFTFGTGTTARTFVAINDATAGYNAATDAIIEVTGLTGTLAIANFVTA